MNGFGKPFLLLLVISSVSARFIETESAPNQKEPAIKICGNAIQPEITEVNKTLDAKMMPGNPMNEISAKGEELWAVGQDNKVYRWSGQEWQIQDTGAWATSIGASPDGWTWHIGTAGNIWRWNVDLAKWEHNIDEDMMRQINVQSKDVAVGVDWDGQTWVYYRGEWIKSSPTNGSEAAMAAVGEQNEFWVINKDQSIYRWNVDSSENDWTKMPGLATYIDVQGPNRVIIATAEENVYIWNGSDWKSVAVKGKKATISQDRYYVVNAAGEVWTGQIAE